MLDLVSVLVLDLVSAFVLDLVSGLRFEASRFETESKSDTEPHPPQSHGYLAR